VTLSAPALNPAASIILEYDCAEIQAAMAVALLRLKNALA
jgi:hypothetical protein